MLKKLKQKREQNRIKREEDVLEYTNLFRNDIIDFFSNLPAIKDSERIKKWDISMIQISEVIKEHSKCAAKKVCCLIVSDNSKGYNILSIGLNGTPTGQTNCCDKWERTEDGWKDLETNTICDKDAHRSWSLFNEVHAETNALAKCNEANISTKDAIAFVSYSPCFNCSKMLVSFGIRKIVFAEKYDDFDSSVKDFLSKNNVEVIHLYKDKDENYIYEKLC